MTSDASGEVTRLLAEWSGGNEDALEDLFPLVYRDLQSRARGLLCGERTDHTLQPTALVHEAYLRLFGPTRTDWKDRTHFLSIASMVMRRILVDHARRYAADKRRGPGKLPLDAVNEPAWTPNTNVIGLDLALQKLSEVDPRQTKVVELRFFGGLSVVETAEVLDISESTVKREWRMARVWLRAEMEGGLASVDPENRP